MQLSTASIIVRTVFFMIAMFYYVYFLLSKFSCTSGFITLLTFVC